MKKTNILALLQGGDRRMIGRADEVAAMVSKQPGLFSELITGLWSSDPLVCMRAADATEKITRKQNELLQPYKKKLLHLMAGAQQQELRWHLALMIPRLNMTAHERRITISALTVYLKDHSSIVKTCALQGLSDLAEYDSATRDMVIEILHTALRSGTPAMKARSRKLLARFVK